VARFEAARSRVDHRAVAVRDGAVHKARPDVALDLDGLVAGAAADAIAVRLVELGVQDFYLQITGEVLCRGEKAPGVPWRIGVVDPRSDAEGGEEPIRALPLRDRALCTSGDYRNTALVDGAVVHHVFDPRTGRNPAHTVCSASVLADSAAVADALGTAFLVLGSEATQRLWPRLQPFGVRGALLLQPDDQGGLRATEITWPKEDS
jgi:thiamine biosynthesis lipoprotein